MDVDNAMFPEQPVVRHVRIRKGARVWQDFGTHIWPNVLHGDASVVFEATPYARGYECRADLFGGHPPHRYGNGCLYVARDDVVSESLRSLLPRNEGA